MYILDIHIAVSTQIDLSACIRNVRLDILTKVLRYVLTSPKLDIRITADSSDWQRIS